MKRNNLVLGLLSVCTIALCFACAKTGQSSENKATTTSDAAQLTANSGKIAYIEVDTVFKHYDMALELGKTFESKSKQLDAELNSKSKTFQGGVLDFQNKVQKGLVTTANAQEIQKQLQAQEQGLYQLREQYQSQLAEEGQVNQRQILHSIMDYLKEYNKTKGYHYILANSFPSTILFADSTLNITREVITGLNAKYKVTKPSDKK
jgi:outer membrane protein